MSKCVLFSKCYSRWHPFLISYLEAVFENIEVVYINSFFKSVNLTFSNSFWIDHLLEEYSLHDVDYAIFDLEFSLLLSPSDINNICLKLDCISFGMGMDDDRFHDINRKIYHFVDAMLTFPLSVERYKLIGIRAIDFFPSFELMRGEPERGGHRVKDIDVLFFGLLKGERKKVVDYLLEKKINVFHPDFSTSDEELKEMIGRAKIVLNLSSGSPVSSNLKQFLPFSSVIETEYPVWQLKSRVFEVGALGVLCVSDDFAGYHLSFPMGELPIAKNKEDLFFLINELLLNEEKFKLAEENFVNIFSERYSLENRVKYFKQACKDCSKQKRIRKGGARNFDLIEAYSLAVKMVYMRSLMPLYNTIHSNMKIGSKLKTILLSLTTLVKILFNYLWIKISK